MDWKEYVRTNYVPGKYGTVRLAKETGVSRVEIRRYIDRGMPIETSPVRSNQILPAGLPTSQKSSGGNPEPHDTILSVVGKGGTIESIADRLGVSERIARAHIDDLRDKGYCIDEMDDMFWLSKTVYAEEQKVWEREWKGDRVIRFGLLGDTHFGSKFTQIEHLHKAYETFKAEGITDVYHTGDLTEGENMRPGHAYECYIHGADQHIDEVVRNYPRIDGIKTSYILGNHDMAFVKHVGLNIASPISLQRPDLAFLGNGQARVMLTPNCSLELRHPGGGSAYSISYKSQKIVESLSGGTKPNIMAFGHYHKLEYLFYRNIHVFQTGTTQAQSNFMRDLGLAAHTGYWIITARVNEDGEVTRIMPEMIPIYKAIPDDWKNFR